MARSTGLRRYGVRRSAVTGGVIVLLVVAGLGGVTPAVAQYDATMGELNRQIEDLRRQGRYAEALAQATRFLAMREAYAGPRHPDVAMELSRVAEINSQLGRYGDAEQAFQ